MMHDDAIEKRTALKLEAETELQAQELADLKLDRDAEREDKLYHLIRMAINEKLLDDTTRDLADEIRKYANQVLHPKKKKNEHSTVRFSSLKIILSTVKVIEKLYS